MTCGACLLVLALVFLPTLAHAEAIPLPGARLVSGCSPCRDGDRVRIVLEIWRPGVSIAEAEIRAAAHTPSGEVLRLPISGTVVVLPAGASSIVILDVEAATVPAGLWLVEAGILEVATGVTLSRDVLGIARE